MVDNVSDARRHTISGAGHAGPLTHPGMVAQQILNFFDAALT